VLLNLALNINKMPAAVSLKLRAAVPQFAKNSEDKYFLTTVWNMNDGPRINFTLKLQNAGNHLWSHAFFKLTLIGE
jgi:hypothetical protein